jgi:hypothetical protein
MSIMQWSAPEPPVAALGHGDADTIMFDRSNPAHVRELARELAEASGLEWESLPILEIACWLQRACTLVDALEQGPWQGFSC